MSSSRGDRMGVDVDDELVLLGVCVLGVGAFASVLAGLWSDGAAWLADHGVFARGAGLLYEIPGAAHVGLDGGRVVIGVGVVIALGVFAMTFLRARREER